MSLLNFFKTKPNPKQTESISQSAGSPNAISKPTESSDTVTKSTESLNAITKPAESLNAISQSIDGKDFQPKVADFKKISNFKKLWHRVFTNAQTKESYDQLIQNITDNLLSSDVGSFTTKKIITELKSLTHTNHSTDLIQQTFINLLLGILSKPNHIGLKEVFLNYKNQNKTLVFLLAGVNGAGKTTTIAKIAHVAKTMNIKIGLIPADTFRAGAIDQLKSWADKLDLPILGNPQPNKDPSAVIHSALQVNLSNPFDCLLIDTSGRLQNKDNLMQQLQKITKTTSKFINDFKSVLILDGTTGQNSLNQVEEFKKITPIDFIVITKLDGTTKGGFVIPLIDQFQLPILGIGLGEKEEDWVDFDPNHYVSSLID